MFVEIRQAEGGAPVVTATNVVQSVQVVTQTPTQPSPTASAVTGPALFTDTPSTAGQQQQQSSSLILDDAPATGLSPTSLMNSDLPATTETSTFSIPSGEPLAIPSTNAGSGASTANQASENSSSSTITTGLLAAIVVVAILVACAIVASAFAFLRRRAHQRRGSGGPHERSGSIYLWDKNPRHTINRGPSIGPRGTARGGANTSNGKLYPMQQNSSSMQVQMPSQIVAAQQQQQQAQQQIPNPFASPADAQAFNPAQPSLPPFRFNTTSQQFKLSMGSDPFSPVSAQPQQQHGVSGGYSGYEEERVARDGTRYVTSQRSHPGTPLIEDDEDGAELDVNPFDDPNSAARKSYHGAVAI